MIERLFGGDKFLAQTRALDATAMRHQVISHNLANANSPNFKRKEVQFETELGRALERCQNPCAPKKSAVADVTPRVVTINTTTTRMDGNNVNLELESANLATNTLRFEVLSQSVGGYFSSLKSVINGGR